jgi:hypothetical protein
MLVSLGSLVDIQNISRRFLDTLSERKDSLFEFLQARVGEPDVVIDVVLELGLRAAAERALEEGSDLSEFLIGVVVNTKLVQDHRVKLVLVQGRQQARTCFLELLHGKIALGEISEELDVCGLSLLRNSEQL